MNDNIQSLVKVVTTESFETLLRENSMLFVEFWAQWCAPCQQFNQTYERVAQTYPMVVFGTVDIEHETSLSETFHIRSVPHLIVFKEGIAIYSESGSIPESTLIELVQQTLTADVSKIRESLNLS